MTATITPFPARSIARLFTMKRLASYHGIMVSVWADDGPYALISYDGAPNHRAWVKKESLSEWEKAMAGEDLTPCA